MEVVEVCVYCEEKKPCVIWKETLEQVCFACRESLLEQEFKNAGIDPFAPTEKGDNNV